ncbi:hypothetical protein EUGRSUZ_G02352 [Eucalyptus grandis]|uniref:Uncharacterized protein n=2 Tax=Eucalyptus grandis TaxID=71139 RepID=A0ACC3K5G4_EUCGR|nr:hypothetical protein EUGRSUZ_G02352 [Eucalyptus grandis]
MEILYRQRYKSIPSRHYIIPNVRHLAFGASTRLYKSSTDLLGQCSSFVFLPLLCCYLLAHVEMLREEDDRPSFRFSLIFKFI